ncbi:MAG: M48 family metalloprotease [Desulfobulbaceae bacterium]|nr:M48 family metalloprotease [Desulfobulbaceae bacterium]
MLAVIRREFDLLDELDITQYMNELGNSVLKTAGSQYFEYHFYVIADKEFNAFATPSGLIFFHSGIINAMDTEGELVSVLAHECGHVMSRHIASRIEKSTKINAVTLAAMMAGIALGGGALSQALITGGMAGGAAMSLNFTRQDEEEADRIGFKLMQEQHRDPGDMVTMLNKMYKASKIRMGNVPQYLLTHPKPELRMHYVQDLIHVKGGKDYRQFEQFDFRRMQKRVESLTVEPQKLFAKYRKIIRETENKDLKMMATYGLGLAELAIGNHDEAIQYLRTVMDYYPDKPILFTDLGRIYLAGGHLKTAIMYLEEARRKNPGNWYGAFYLAKALQRAGNDTRAEALYRQVMGDSPDFPGSYFQLAQIESKKGLQGLSHLFLGKNFYFEGNFTSSKFNLQKALDYSDLSVKDRADIKDLLGKIKKIEDD